MGVCSRSVMIADQALGVSVRSLLLPLPPPLLPFHSCSSASLPAPVADSMHWSVSVCEEEEEGEPISHVSRNTHLDGYRG